MATIPKLGSARGVSPDVSAAPTRSIASAGLVGEAISGVGQQLTALTSQLNKKRKRAEVQEFSDNATRQYSRNVKQAERELKMKHSGSDHANYSKELEEFSRNERERLGGEATSSEAREAYNSKSNAFFGNTLDKGDAFENSERSKFYVNRRVVDSDEAKSFYFDNPDPFDANEDLRSFKSEIDVSKGVLFDEASGELIKENAAKNYREGVFQGMISQGLYGQAEEVLDSGVEGTAELLEGMSGDEKRKLRNQIQAGKKQQTSTFNRETKILAKNAALELQSGELLSPERESEIRETKQRLQALPDGIDKERAIRQLEISQVVGNELQTARKMSQSDLAQIDLNQVVKDSRLINLDTEENAKARIVQGINSIMREREADPKAYVNKVFPNKTDNIASNIEQQKALGIRNPRALTKGEAVNQAELINIAPTFKDKAIAFDAFLEAHGDNSDDALNDMVKDKLVDPGFMFVSKFESNRTKERVISNMTQKRAINDNFKKLHPGEKLDDEITGEISDFMDVFAKAGNETMMKSIRESVELEAKRLMNENDLSASDAIETAKETVVDNNFKVISNNNSKILFPREFEAQGINEQDVDAYLNISLTDAGIEQLGIKSFRHINFIGDQSEFNEFLREQSFWVSNDTQDGLQLRVADPKTGLTRRMTNANGEVIDVKFSDMPNNQLVLDDLNSFFSVGIREGFKKTPFGQSLSKEK